MWGKMAQIYAIKTKNHSATLVLEVYISTLKKDKAKLPSGAI